MTTNVRVELRFNVGNSRFDRERATLNLIRQFKRAVAEAGILRELREREFYEKPGEKKRNKQRQAELQRKYAEAAGKDLKPRRPNKDQRHKNKQ